MHIVEDAILPDTQEAWIYPRIDGASGAQVQKHHLVFPIPFLYDYCKSG